jgi:hypothetical protein
MECFLSVMDWKGVWTLRRLDPGTPEAMQNSASRVLRQTCVRLRRRHSWQVNVTGLFRAASRESGQNGKKFGRSMSLATAFGSMRCWSRICRVI